MFKIIIPCDRVIQQAKKGIFGSSFMALHSVTYVTFSLYPIEWILQNKYFLLQYFSLPIEAIVCNYLKDMLLTFLEL